MRKIIGFTLLFVWLGFLWGLYFALPARASAFCEVLPTADGFVALREEPRANAKLIGRMKAGDEVMIGQGERGRWIEVTWFRGQDGRRRALRRHRALAG